MNMAQKLQSMLTSKAVLFDIMVSQHFDAAQF